MQRRGEVVSHPLIPADERRSPLRRQASSRAGKLELADHLVAEQAAVAAEQFREPLHWHAPGVHMGEKPVERPGARPHVEAVVSRDRFEYPVEGDA